MAARNPFERVMHNDTADVDVARDVPRDLMADAFLSELMHRLGTMAQYGHRGGYRYGGHADGMGEHNGFPVDHGLRGTAHSFPAISPNPAVLNPFDLGSRGQAGFFDDNGGELRDDPFAPVMPEELENFDIDGLDMIDPETQFDLDAAPYAGTDGSGLQDPFALPRQPALPPMPPYRPDPNLDRLRRSLKPGIARLSTTGYSEPITDPYADDLTAMLRRIVRQA